VPRIFHHQRHELREAQATWATDTSIAGTDGAGAMPETESWHLKQTNLRGLASSASNLRCVIARAHKSDIRRRSILMLLNNECVTLKRTLHRKIFRYTLRTVDE
jgi:hypothetical protein